MAELIYNEHYFEMANPNIYENEELREPQIQGYQVWTYTARFS